MGKTYKDKAKWKRKSDRPAPVFGRPAYTPRTTDIRDAGRAYRQADYRTPPVAQEDEYDRE